MRIPFLLRIDPFYRNPTSTPIGKMFQNLAVVSTMNADPLVSKMGDLNAFRNEMESNFQQLRSMVEGVKCQGVSGPIQVNNIKIAKLVAEENTDVGCIILYTEDRALSVRLKLKSYKVLKELMANPGRIYSNDEMGEVVGSKYSSVPSIITRLNKRVQNDLNIIGLKVVVNKSAEGYSINPSIAFDLGS